MAELTARVDLLRAPGHLIRRAQQRHQAKWAQIIGGGLTSVQFAVLALLDAHPGADQRTLARSLSIDTSTLAEVCQRLVDRGLVVRRRAREDARRNRLELSDEGCRILKEAIPAVDRVGEALLEPLEPHEREQLMALLRRVIGEASKSGAGPASP